MSADEVIAIGLLMILAVTTTWGVHVARIAARETGTRLPRMTFNWHLAGFLICTDSTFYIIFMLAVLNLVDLPDWAALIIVANATYWPVGAFVLWARETGRPL